MEIAILAVSIGFLALAERLPTYRFQASPLRRPFALTDVACLLSGGVALGVSIRMIAVKTSAALALPRFDLGPVPTAVAAVVLYDLGAFLSHDLLHRNDWLWEIHKVHHSSRTLDWLATFRAHLFEHALRHTISIGMLLLVGFPVGAVGLAAAIHSSWAALNHANLRLDLQAIERFLVTPRLHRLHHVPAAGARNLGTIFSIWDRVRGSLVCDLPGPLEPLGVAGEVETYPQQWLALFLEPLRRPLQHS